MKGVSAKFNGTRSANARNCGLHVARSSSTIQIMSARYQLFLLRWTNILAALTACSLSAQSNLLINPSFEKPGANPITYRCILNDLPDWEFASNGANRCPAAAPDGNVIVSFDSFLAQNVPTVPGRHYFLKFASQGGLTGASFGPQLITTLTNLGGTNYYFNQPWFYSYCHFEATGSVTRLSLLATQWVNVDDLLLGWLDEPVTLVQPPTATEVPLGGRATLTVKAQGGPPLTYQWFKDSAPIEGATGAVYYITNGTSEMAGLYHVTVSNHVNSAVSAPVQLTLDASPREPQVTFQPEGFALISGSAAILRSAASGTPPLRFQWRRDGTNLPGETNTLIKFTPLSVEHGGIYEVTVENQHGSTVSLPATVDVKTVARVGALQFYPNTFPAYRQPCFDSDGVTPLAGSAYRCQFYAGEDSARMSPLGLPQEFRSGGLAGLPTSLPGLWFTFPDNSTNWNIQYQLRAWESAFGASYEESRSLGGKVGKSLLLSRTLKPIDVPPGQVIAPGLTLHAGLPGFTTGRISVGGTTEDGLVEWELTGAAGYTYLIERRHPPNTWLPFQVLSNASGIVIFTDPDQRAHSPGFYRARMLD